MYFFTKNKESALHHYVQQQSELKEHAKDVSFHFLDARRREKDFLSRRTDSLLKQHHATLQTGREHLAKVHHLAHQAEDRTLAEQIEQGLQAYDTAFAELVQLQKSIGFTENDGLTGALRASVHQVEEILKAQDDLKMTVLMLQMRRHEKDFLARRERKYLDDMQKRAAAFDKVLDGSPLSPEIKDTIRTRMKAYQDDFAAVVEATLTMALRLTALSDIYARTEPLLETLEERADRQAAEALTQQAELTHQTQTAILLTLLTGAGLVSLVGLWLARNLYVPLNQITDAMRRVAAGDLAVDIPARERRDEVGGMAAALLVFRDNARQADQLRHQQEQDRLRAEEEKIHALRTMADIIESETRAAVDSMAERTGSLARTAQGMARSASAVGENSQTVASAAAQALSNAQTVASASEQLTSSIQEIGQQVTRSGDLTAQAVSVSGAAEQAISQLATNVARIGEVTGLISDIASQTNLLALNATVEAARAGDMGKGFAVVAHEVKGLATQTAKATEDISAQITAIQNSTRMAVDAVSQIIGAIQSVEGISSAIAAAIEEQAAATQEIARNVTETSAAAQEVANRIADVSDEAASTGERAGQVSTISSDVAEAIAELRRTMVHTVRTATTEVNRRAHERRPMQQHIQVEWQGRTLDATLEDLSDGGARITTTHGPFTAGHALVLHYNGQPRPATVVCQDQGGVRLRFG